MYIYCRSKSEPFTSAHALSSLTLMVQKRSFISERKGESRYKNEWKKVWRASNENSLSLPSREHQTSASSLHHSHATPFNARARFLSRHYVRDQFIRDENTYIAICMMREMMSCHMSCARGTFSQMDRYSNRIASVFKDAGYVKGDAVALLMPNRPAYVATWLGLGKLGVVTALINTNLRQQSLVHCLTIAKVKAIIYVDELAFGEI